MPNNKSNLTLASLYKEMNTCETKNKKDSQYWIYKVESIISKKDDVNKRFLRIQFFNRKLNENNNLMRLYFRINGEDINSDVFKVVPTYKNPNVLYTVIERDLEEEHSAVELLGYILDGHKITINGDFISDIHIEEDEIKLAGIKEMYYKDNDMYCSNIPYVGDDYWICACGNYLTDEDICPRCMKEKDEIKKISYFKKEDLLVGLSDRIKVNTNETVEETIKKYSQYYQQRFGIDEINTINSVDRNILIAKQNQLIDQEIDNIIATKKMVFKKNLNLQEDVEAYGQKYAHGVITAEMIINQLDLAQIKEDYKAYCQKVKDNGAKAKKYGTYGGIALGIVVLAVGVFFLVTNVFMKDSGNTANNNTSNTTETSSELLTLEEYSLESGYYERIQVSATEDATFESSDTNVVTVDSDGIMYGVGGGSATVKVTDTANNKEYECKVTVSGDAVTATDEEEEETSEISTTDGYILPNSSTTLLTDDDLKDLSAQELRYARNEIYARHGCTFEDDTLQDYFESCDWYEDKGYVATEYDGLSDVEKTNIDLIKEYEEKAE